MGWLYTSYRLYKLVVVNLRLPWQYGYKEHVFFVALRYHGLPLGYVFCELLHPGRVHRFSLAPLNDYPLPAFLKRQAVVRGDVISLLPVNYAPGGHLWKCLQAEILKKLPRLVYFHAHDLVYPFAHIGLVIDRGDCF